MPNHTTKTTRATRKGSARSQQKVFLVVAPDGTPMGIEAATDHEAAIDKVFQAHLAELNRQFCPATVHECNFYKGVIPTLLNDDQIQQQIALEKLTLRERADLDYMEDRLAVWAECYGLPHAYKVGKGGAE